jgi:uncharacterized RDD family membrane protein YckC
MSFGKFLLGLRVVGIDQRPIGLPQALQRSLVWTVASAVLPGGLEIAMISAWGRQRVIELLLDVGTLGLLFMSARPENGFAGLHETLTGTRVVTGAASRIRDSLRLPGWRQPPDPGAQRIGAYLVVESLGPTDGGHLLLGYDDVLRRHVWIHTQPAGTPPVTAARRLLGRPGRLRWLAGRRSATENWDAYDAPAGVAFTELVRVRQPWSLVRFLLYDVAREVTAIVSAGEEVTVGLDRLWVTSHGTAVLLDFPAPGVQASAQGSFTDLAWAQLHGLFMDMAILGVAGHPRVASVTSAAEPVPIPLHAHEFLMKLEQNELASLPAVTSALEALLPRPTIVTRRRRVVQLLAVAGMPLAALVTGSYFGLQRGLSVMGFFVLMVAVPAIWCAAMFRGGLVLRLLGITIATRRGAAVSRPYALLRAVAAWFAPLALVVGILYRLDWLVVVAFLVVAASIIAAVLTPDRGLHDRLLGTRLVRR